MTDRYTEAEVLAAITKSKGNVSKAAASLKCSGQTVRNYASRFPTIQDVIDARRERIVDLAEDGLETLVRKKEPSAIYFALKTLGKNRGYVERTENREVTDADIEREIRDMERRRRESLSEANSPSESSQ